LAPKVWSKFNSNMETIGFNIYFFTRMRSTSGRKDQRRRSVDSRRRRSIDDSRRRYDSGKNRRKKSIDSISLTRYECTVLEYPMIP
jgi:hypothetical protein